MAPKALTVGLCIIKLMLLLTHLAESRMVNSSQQLSVEVLVVVDNIAYQQWHATAQGPTSADRSRATETVITKYVQAVFSGMNVVLLSLRDYGVKLDVRIADIIQAEGSILGRVRGQTVEGKEALWDFRQWLNINNHTGFDHALLLTGFTVAEGDNLKAEGIANKASMCRESSLSVVESKPNQNAVLTAVHELGHSFNASHDGEGNDCKTTSDHVMSAVRSGTSHRRWRFSSCSAANIKSFLGLLMDGNDCLSPTMTSAEPVNSVFLGELYSADQLCQMSHGPESYVCRSLYTGRTGYSDLCNVIWCSTGGSDCSTIVGTDGIPCGHKKRCMAGKCVRFHNDPGLVSDTCPLGDNPGKAFGFKSCGDVVKVSANYCQIPVLHQTCCGTCEALSTGSKDCPYGDVWPTCRTYHCLLGFGKQCCKTCANL